jgi:hypothetical protein
MTRTKRVDRLDLRAAVSRARSRRDTETDTDTVKFAQATLAAGGLCSSRCGHAMSLSP